MRYSVCPTYKSLIQNPIGKENVGELDIDPMDPQLVHVRLALVRPGTKTPRGCVPFNSVIALLASDVDANHTQASVAK